MRTQRTEFVAEFFGQHRHRPVDKIYRGSSLAGLFVHHIMRLYIMSHIGNMYSDLIVAVFKHLERKSIVKILCICRVNSKCQDIPEVASALEIFCSYLL